ncbi:hypothetical protein MMC17_002517 [Xylographa soralifera]|nr:hypothetical protein [Xylographa soralifera]
MSGVEVLAVIGIVAAICSMYQDGHVLLSRLENQHRDSRDRAVAAGGVDSSDAVIAHLKASLKRGEEMIQSQFDKDYQSLGQASCDGDAQGCRYNFQSKLISTFRDSLRKDTPFDPFTLQDISDRSQEEAMTALVQVKQRIETAQTRAFDGSNHGFTTTFGEGIGTGNLSEDQYKHTYEVVENVSHPTIRISKSGRSAQYVASDPINGISSIPAQFSQVDREQSISQAAAAAADHIVEIPSTLQAVSSVPKISKPSLSELWEWYVRTGSGFLIFLASLTTALVMITFAKTDVSAAFTVASWILAGGTLLSVTVKAYFCERPENASGVRLRILP